MSIDTNKVLAVSQKKRVQVHLQPDVYEIVKTISELGGVTISGLLGEIIDENKAGLQIIHDALLLAKNQDHTATLDRIQNLLLDTMSKGIDAQKEIVELRTKHGK